jgi:hypothetical protein
METWGRKRFRRRLRTGRSIELRTDKVYRQKLDYIHSNPVKAGFCKLPVEYKYSSALFYETGVDNPSASSGGISFSSSGLTYNRWRVEILRPFDKLRAQYTRHGVKTTIRNNVYTCSYFIIYLLSNRLFGELV